MARRSPVMKGTPAVVKMPGAAHRTLRRDHALSECRQGGNDLEHGPRRILPLRGAVMQRKMRVSAQRPPRGRGEPGDEGVRIKRRLTRQGENLTVTRVEGDNRAAVLFEELFGQLLQLQIESQDEIQAWCRWARRDDLCFTSKGVDLHLAYPRLTAQHGSVRLFEPGLPNQIAHIIAKLFTEIGRAHV